MGITKFAADQLGDIVYVDLPEDGKDLSKADVFGSIESVKTAADVYMPCDGKVVEVNSELDSEPQKVGIGAETEGWLVKIEVTNEDDLMKMMDEEAYREFLTTLEDH